MCGEGDQIYKSRRYNPSSYTFTNCPIVQEAGFELGSSQSPFQHLSTTPWLTPLICEKNINGSSEG